MFILGQFFGRIFAAPRLPLSLFLPFIPWPNMENFRASLRSPERDVGWDGGGDAPLPKKISGSVPAMSTLQSKVIIASNLYPGFYSIF